MIAALWISVGIVIGLLIGLGCGLECLETIKRRQRIP